MLREPPWAKKASENVKGAIHPRPDALTHHHMFAYARPHTPSAADHHPLQQLTIDKLMHTCRVSSANTVLYKTSKETTNSQQGTCSSQTHTHTGRTDIADTFHSLIKIINRGFWCVSVTTLV